MMRSSITALLVILATGRAHADAKAEAKKHVEAATQFHEHRYWAKALDELNIAYTLDPQPDLLYAIAQLHVALGDCAQAITFYERYIATKPSAEREAVARKAIHVCETNPPPPEAGPETAPPAPEQRPPASPATTATTTTTVTAATARPITRPWYSDTLGDLLVGGGVVAGVAAVFAYSSSRGDLDSANAATSYPQQAQLYNSAQRARDYSLVLGAAGAVLVGAGVLHYALADRGALVVPVDHGGVVSWSGRW